MRDYLYIWHDRDQHALVVSGIEFVDLLPSLASQEGVLLLEHASDTCSEDPRSFSYVDARGLAALASEDIYSWGNFSWVDYGTQGPPQLEDDAIAELLFFAHKHRPLRETAIPGLGNKFLACAHDDGWYLRLYYSSWSNVEALLRQLVPILHPEQLAQLEHGLHGFWISNGRISVEEQTDDVDSILNRRL